MFTAYDGQKFETLEKCEVHNKEIKEDMVARDEEKRLTELVRKEKLANIKTLGDQLNAAIAEYEKTYGVSVRVMSDDPWIKMMDDFLIERGLL